MADVLSMAAWIPDAVPTVMALAGATEAAAIIAEAAVSERRILRIEDPPRGWLWRIFSLEQAIQQHRMAAVLNRLASGF